MYIQCTCNVHALYSSLLLSWLEGSSYQIVSVNPGQWVVDDFQSELTVVGCLS